jgi:hypothetical protein
MYERLVARVKVHNCMLLFFMMRVSESKLECYIDRNIGLHTQLARIRAMWW